MKTFSVRNLDQWQHYKDRNPPWIKLHVVLLNNYDFGRLPDASKAHALCIMVLASQCDNSLPWDPKWIASKINATTPVDLDRLVSAGVIEVKHDASATLADGKQSACVETEESRGETETEERQRRASAPGDLDKFPASLRTARFAATWSLWEKHRREIRKPLTQTSVEQQFKVLASWGEARAIAAIEFTIGQGWTGIKEPYATNGNGAHGKRRPEPEPEIELTREQAEAEIRAVAKESGISRQVTESIIAKLSDRYPKLERALAFEEIERIAKEARA